MKNWLSTLCISLGFVSFCHAQSTTDQMPPMDKSPMDMSYFPNNYPVLKISDKVSGPPVARVIYGRPQRGGRTIFGDLVEYGKVWRLGANEATEIEFFRDVLIAGKRVIKGRYTLYALVEPATWTLILSRDTDTWGSFKYDPKNDVLRSPVPVQKTTEPVETLSMLFEKQGTGFDLDIAWENEEVKLPISLTK
ncbi:MAG TPA: DUF2911 domain-containing protein [Chitinophagaceae bacterium]|nr:DUF2911 domain-containing protein [Chitinophagaceae bacterium]